MASPKMNMGRVVRSGEDAVFTFQLPETGLAGQVTAAAYRLDTTTTHPAVASSVQETQTPGTYMLTVSSGNMVADGVYYASISHQDIAIRIPAWTYDPSNEFDKVIADIAAHDTDIKAAITALDTKVQTETDAIDATLSAIDTKLQTETDAIDADISALSTLVTNETNAIDAALTALDTKVQNETDAIDSALTALDTKLQNETNAIDTELSNLSTLVTTETNAIDTALSNLDAKVQAENDATQAEIGDFQGLTSTVNSGWTLADMLGASDFDAANQNLHDWLTTKFTGVVTEIDANEVKIDAVNAAVTALDTKVQNETDALDTAVAAVDLKVSNLDTKVQNETDAIDAAITALDTKVQNETDAIDTAIAALDTKVQTETDALDTAVAALDTKVQTETDAIDAAITALDTKVQNETDALDTAVAAVKTRVDLLQTDADAITRYNSLDTSISAVKAVLDESLVVNSQIIPAVPSEFLSPMTEQIMRIAVSTVGPVNSGTTAGALEDPDNNECGVRGFLIDGSTGALNEFNYATELFETNAKASSLPAASGAGISNTYRLMKRTAVGQFEAYYVIAANRHGMLQWDFIIQDSDPSGSPQTFNTVRYTVMRRQAAFNSYGAF